MPVAIIGAKGNMARRYAAILHYLGRASWGLDQDWTRESLDEMAAVSDGFIIATPTETHHDWVLRLARYRKPILCEKPVTKNLDELKAGLKLCKSEGTPFDMVFQYRYLTTPSIGESRYNYWNHGRDGLVWDCLQIIGLARGRVDLDEDSPIWRCVINGRRLNIADMDLAYIAMIRDWLRTPGADLGRIIAIHEKTAQMEKELG